jgi:hypothetical protein
MEFNDLLFRNKRLKKMETVIYVNGSQYKVEYFQNRSKHIYLYDDYDNETFIETTLEQLPDLVKEVHNGRKISGIEKHFDKILPNVFDGYVTHISNTKNRESILYNGLIPNGKADLEIMMASSFLDAKRPKTIPKDFYRQMCIYTRPEETYWFLNNNREKSSDLYIIDISKYNWRIASEGISGFCIPYWENNCFAPPRDWEKYRKLYWQNCFSKDDYLNQTEQVKKAEKTWSLDEILVPNYISPDDIILIGTFIEKQFYYYDIIKQFAINDFYLDFKSL